jgi:hypothetical protein
LRLQDEFWQVVLKKPDTPLRVHAVEKDLDQASYEFCTQDLQQLAANGLPIAFVLLRHATQGIRLILRLSHAQYDGISFPIIFQSLMDSYNSVSISRGPDFSKFLSYAVHKQNSSRQYWKTLLQGSSPTMLEPSIRPRRSIELSHPMRIYEEAVVDLPHLPSKITSATLVSSAWALLLSQITGNKDVVYGNVVAGRNSAMQGIEAVVGACLNIIPVRVNLDSLSTTKQLLQLVQAQFLALGESDSLGFKDIIKNCTEWPTDATFGSVIQHQNIDEHPEIQSSEGQSKIQFYDNPHLVPPSLFVASYPQGDRLQIKLFANTHIVTVERARTLLQGLCKIIDTLGSDANGTLASRAECANLGV